MAEAEPGTYALLLKLDRHKKITVGKLGTFDFPGGYYLYMGSALGPGGLRARLARHQRGAAPQSNSGKKLHWHIDYLLQQAQLIEVWSVASEERLECRWGKVAQGLAGAQIPVPGFGSSDCRCPAHLIYFSARPDREQFEQVLQKLRLATMTKKPIGLLAVGHERRPFLGKMQNEQSIPDSTT